MKLLHIIATPRGAKSRTLQISNKFLAEVKARNKDLQVDTLELSAMVLPPISGEVTDAKYTLLQGRELNDQAASDWATITKYAEDFLSYDCYLISSPMWNFSIPYQLKHYIDIIMQPGMLFRFTPNGVEGLAKNKKMFCITSRGSDYSEGTYLQQFDFQEPYLKSIFGMAGIVDITFLNAQPMDYSPEVAQLSMNKALEETRLMTV